MQTKVMKCGQPAYEYAAKLIKSGDIAAIPTETVYGLAADAFNPCAVKKIFAAKGRPQDNPLIVHISDINMMKSIVSDVSSAALKIAEKFWPGPLTIIFPKASGVPYEVTAGLETVAVRFPAHAGAQEIIKACGTPLAAPSANLSGMPSPTSARHVFDDLNGKIKLIVDGGSCSVGVESTVIAVSGESVSVLRPGMITVEDLKAVVPDVTVDKAVLEGAEKNQRVASPGMKYKHYAPKAEVTVIDGDFEKFKQYVQSRSDSETYCLVFDSEEKSLSLPCLTMGKAEDENEHARVLFERLRELDELDAKKVFARMPSLNGVGLAVYNRLIRAAAFRVIRL